MNPPRRTRSIIIGGVLVAAGIVIFQQAGSSSPDTPQQLPPARPVPVEVGPAEDEPLPQAEGVPESWAESMQRQREAGWTAFVIEGDQVAYKAWEFNRPDNPAAPGEWTEAVDAQGNQIGVYVHPIGFVSLDEFDPATFDWRAEAERRGARPEWIEQQSTLPADFPS